VKDGITSSFRRKDQQRRQVEDTSGRPAPGLYAAGEIVGSLFYHNYASGTGLMSGTVFGRSAGGNAAGHAKG
jgi:tricarballylate dehydrogenase